MDLFLIAVLEKTKVLLINFLLGSHFSLLLADFTDQNSLHGIVLSSEKIYNIAVSILKNKVSFSFDSLMTLPLSYLIDIWVSFEISISTYVYINPTL